MRKLFIQTKQIKQIINITPKVEELLKKYPARDGLVHLFLRHTSAALITAYIEPGMDLEMIGAFEVMIPHRISKTEEIHTHHMGHLPAHVVGSILGPSLVIPVKNNKLLLGTFQSIILVELNGPLKREIILEYKEDKGY